MFGNAISQAGCEVLRHQLMAGCISGCRVHRDAVQDRDFEVVLFPVVLHQGLKLLVGEVADRNEVDLAALDFRWERRVGAGGFWRYSRIDHPSRDQGNQAQQKRERAIHSCSITKMLDSGRLVSDIPLTC